MLINSLKGRAIFSRQDGTIMDFREQGLEVFVVDKRSKILKPNKEFVINFELLTSSMESNNKQVVTTNVNGDNCEEHF